MSEKTASLTIRRKALTELLDHEKNPRRHPPQGSEAWEALRKSLANDYFDPLIWNERNGKLVAGHLRKKVMLAEGYTHADVVVVDYDDKTHLARMLAANTHSGENDKSLLQEIVGQLTGAESMIDLTGSPASFVEDMVRPPDPEPPPAPEDKQTLAERFGLTPLSVLDARQHYWKKRAEAWENILGIEMLVDPVLMEAVMRWYLPKDGKIIDLRAKYPLRGLVAGHIGAKYTGITNEGNAAANAALVTTKKEIIHEQPVWQPVNEDCAEFDLALYELPEFTSSKEMRDQIALAMTKAGGYLRDNRFLVVWIGRQPRLKKLSDPEGAAVGEVLDLAPSSSFDLHSEVILLRPLGGTPMACRSFPATRKLARCHSTMLVFFKGKAEEIERQFPFPAMGELSE